MIKFYSFDRLWHTGSTITSGFLWSRAAALIIMARAWFKLSDLFEPIFPNCIKARVKDLSLGANVIVSQSLGANIKTPLHTKFNK